MAKPAFSKVSNLSFSLLCFSVNLYFFCMSTTKLYTIFHCFVLLLSFDDFIIYYWCPIVNSFLVFCNKKGAISRPLQNYIYSIRSQWFLECFLRCENFQSGFPCRRSYLIRIFRDSLCFFKFPCLFVCIIAKRTVYRGIVSGGAQDLLPYSHC